MTNQKELATAALMLLQRVDLKGSEVGAFVQISNWLSEMADPKEEAPK